MAYSCIAEIKDLVDALYGVVEGLDEKGLANAVEHCEDGLKGLTKADLLLFIIRMESLNEGKMISHECLDYVNQCLGYNFTRLTFRKAKGEVQEKEIPEMCLALPYFILIDRHIGGCRLSSIYIQTLGIVLLGYMNCEEKRTLEKAVKYYRWMKCCVRMVEKALDVKMDYDPLIRIDEENRELVRAAAMIDEKVNKDDPVIALIEETLCRTMENEDAIDAETDVEETGDDTDPEKVIELELDESEDDSEMSEDITDFELQVPHYTVKKCCRQEESALDRLNALIGLTEVKEQINSMLNVLKVRQRCREVGINRPAISMHMVFMGNPGTGKTTVARLIGEIFCEEGLLSKGHFIEVTRADLVGKYVGHTAPKVRKVFEKAKGGVLFIDEAYALTDEEDDYGTEAIDTLIKFIEEYREDTVVIVAGYTRLMQEFLDSNPGLRSRFPIVVNFPDYGWLAMDAIFRQYCRENCLEAEKDALVAVRRHFRDEVNRHKRINGNARDVRNYFEQALINQANRLVREGAMEREDLCCLKKGDLPQKVIIRKVEV